MEYFDIHTHSRRSDGSVQILNVLPGATASTVGAWSSIGLHPWYLTAENKDAQLEAVERHAGTGAVKLIGECGFDRLRGPTMAVQHSAFRQQAELAVACAKPLIIHCVRAFDELLPYGRKYASQVPMIIHGFHKSPELARQLQRHGFLLSFGAAIMQEDSNAAVALQQTGPPFFLETDDNPTSIQRIYERAAFLRNITVDELKAIIFAGWKTLQLI